MAYTVIYARAQSEFDAEEDLKDFNAYCPRLQTRVKLRHGHGKLVTCARPRFKSYLFAPEHAELMDAIRWSRYALGVVRFGNVIASVEDEVVEALRSVDDAPPSAPLPLSVGAYVRVAEGLLAGRQGTVTHLKANTAHLSLMGTRCPVVVPPLTLERVALA